MNTLLQLILPSLVLPILLSSLLLFFSGRFPAVISALPLVWLPSCFWLVGWPNAAPEEAVDWLWILAMASMGISGLMQHQGRLEAVVQSLILALFIVLLSWPVLRHQADLSVVTELIALLLAGFVLFHRAVPRQSSTPVRVLAISSGGLGLVTALGGSVLIGQLAGALSSVLIIFVLYVLYRQVTVKPGSVPFATSPVLQLYFALLLIARIYAEIPLTSAFLLLAAPLMLLLPKQRICYVGSVISVALALLWLLTTADSSSYY